MDPYNAKRARVHTPPSLASKPVGLLRSAEMRAWRDGLIAKGLARDTVNRVRTCVRAALSLAAKRDKRIVNRSIWEDDFDALPNATEARNVILPDTVVTKLITEAFARDRQLGLLLQVIAETGARPSQVVRLDIADLDAANSRLLMPRSGKGHAHVAGLDPKTVTLYALRHSYISRALLRGISITLVADATDTSEKEIRRHYAKLISDHSGEIMRRALLDVSQPSAADVVALKG